MRFFDAVPSDLFSPLASPNRALYADALDVLYTAYRENLKIREDALYSMLRSRLEQQLADATFDGEDIDEEELRDISGRARFLIRKLCSKGWFEKERGNDFEEYITVPSYSSRLLELFHQLRDDSPVRGYSYVFGTFSALKVAHESGSVYDKMAAIYSAYDNTSALINLLQMVYHNVKHYFQMQLEMQDVNQVLASHFNDFGQKVIEAYIRPLKIKDSVPKYRVPIQTILKSWEEDDSLLLAMSNAALQDKRESSLERCRADLLQKIYWIEERYDNLEQDYLEEIDAQVRRYTRAATQKIENLTNRDQSVRGNLNMLLTALSRNRRAGELVDQIQPIFQLCEQSFLSEKSLWYRKRPGKRTKAAPVLIQDVSPDAEAAARESALEQFQNDFLAKLKSSIDQVYSQVNSLNRALKQANFGTDRYRFCVGPNPDYADYYNMITSPDLMEGDMGLFALPFQEKYGPLIDKLFSQITTADDTQLNARKQSELQENIVRYTDFRTYLRFDLETTDQNGSKQLLSQTLNMKSGGETQTPFYIAVLASFAQLYRVNDTTSFGNTVRLVVFDEAFNKMDSDRIIESVRLLRKMGLQAIVCTPPDKVSDIMPIADRTLLVDKTGYRMHIIPFSKEYAG